MTIYFTSDWHFGHSRAFIYEPRGFSCIEEHDENIIIRHNEIIKPDDIVFCLGDCMLGSDHEYGLNCISRLNGQIKIIRGNHCTDKRWKEYATLPNVQTLGLAHILKEQGYRFYLCHYKTETSYIENMAPLKNHLINLHGHTHNSRKFESDIPFQYNVALDAHNCYPVSIETIINDINKKAKECLSYL